MVQEVVGDDFWEAERQLLSRIPHDLRLNLRYPSWKHVHNHPDTYWCPDCWKWRLDCEHLVEPLSSRHVLLNDWLLIYAAYDRDKRVLEICFSHRVRYQYRNVPLATALALVRAPRPGHYWKENIERRYRQCAQVRGRYYSRQILMEMARAVEERIDIQP